MHLLTMQAVPVEYKQKHGKKGRSNAATPAADQPASAEEMEGGEAALKEPLIKQVESLEGSNAAATQQQQTLATKEPLPRRRKKSRLRQHRQTAAAASSEAFAARRGRCCGRGGRGIEDRGDGGKGRGCASRGGAAVEERACESLAAERDGLEIRASMSSPSSSWPQKKP